MYDDVTSVAYMISFDHFPVRNGEYDLSFQHRVEFYLWDELTARMPNATVTVWSDNPEFNPHKDFIVTWTGTEDDTTADREAHIRELIEFELLPTALDFAFSR